MTAQDIKNAIDQTVNDFLTNNGLSVNEELIAAVNTSLTDAIADTLDTVNPTHTYPPVLK